MVRVVLKSLSELCHEMNIEPISSIKAIDDSCPHKPLVDTHKFAQALYDETEIRITSLKVEYFQILLHRDDDLIVELIAVMISNACLVYFPQELFSDDLPNHISDLLDHLEMHSKAEKLVICLEKSWTEIQAAVHVLLTLGFEHTYHLQKSILPKSLSSFVMLGWEF
ncbi:hypothetical protein RF11_09278 [Thelohanellus kitauei]|uniref:Ornithine decarboxylase antizyme n=1 Tax=Thelohanellus kitauei TaxID=669202 RepID=A0A0C2J6S3_THEKT|nr:hypothetical protein RF11_09278 [Thelohanellus kitauei]